MKRPKTRRGPGRPRTDARGRAVSVYLKPEQAQSIDRAAAKAHRSRGQFIFMSALLEAESILAAPPEPRPFARRPYDHEGGDDASAWFTRAQFALCRRAAHYAGRSMSHFVAEAAAAAARETLAVSL